MLRILLALSCTEYEVVGGNTAAGGITTPEYPDIVVTPDSVFEAGVCGSLSQVVTASNVGGADLVIDGVWVDGAAWVLEPVSVPVTVPAGGSTTFTVTGADGDASLFIGSNDPDLNVVEVELSVGPDLPPSLQLLGPPDSTIFESGQEASLEVLVSDREDAPVQLAVSWASDVDGPLGTVQADGTGHAVFAWPASARTAGEHLLTVEVADTCGNVVSSQLPVCQQEGYTSEGLDISSWHFEGSSRWDSANDWLELTQAVGNQVGSAFQTADVVRGTDVEIELQFYIGGGSGADGISLTALDLDRATTYLGGTGCGIGYGGDASCTAGPALPGWSLEVDTYYNDGQDPTADDHLTFVFDGDVDDPEVWAVLPEMEDTGWHTLTVRVSAPRLTVLVDGVTTIDQDVTGHFDFPAYVGFTAGTGGDTNFHLIDALTVTQYTCEEG